MAAQILPGGETPGAKEAGAIYFIDRALAGFESDKRDLYKTGLAATQENRKKLFPDSTSIAALTEEQAYKLVESIETTEFFEINFFRTAEFRSTHALS